MRVIDAGVVVALLVGDLDAAALGEEDLVAPHLLDSEVVDVLRRLVLHGALTEEQGAAALDGFLQPSLTRWPVDWLRLRLWELRRVTAHDASYVALAEALGATALLTTDARLAAAPSLRCRVDVLA